jgi:hypothetical protein
MVLSSNEGRSLLTFGRYRNHDVIDAYTLTRSRIEIRPIGSTTNEKFDFKTAYRVLCVLQQRLSHGQPCTQQPTATWWNREALCTAQFCSGIQRPVVTTTTTAAIWTRATGETTAPPPPPNQPHDETGHHLVSAKKRPALVKVVPPQGQIPQIRHWSMSSQCGHHYPSCRNRS